MSKKKTTVPEKQASNRRPPPEETRWKPGQSGNPAGRPPSEVTLISKQKALYASPAPEKMLEGIRDFIPPEWTKDGRKVTWLEAQVIRNSSKAMSLKFGDNMAKLLWEMLEGKATLRIAGPGDGPIPLAMNLDSLDEQELKDLRKLLLKAGATTEED